MNKTIAALVTGAFAAGAGTVTAVGALTEPDPLELRLVNVRLTRWAESDGGVVWGGRACGYLMDADAGHSAEPCWDVNVPGAVFLGVETSILSGKK